jgi:hypothetical protein
MSRHLYDLAKLDDAGISENALKDNNLRRIVAIQQVDGQNKTTQRKNKRH